MTLFDRVFSGNDAVYGLTEGAIDAAIAQHGEDKAVSFPDTAYSLPCYYAVTGTKVTNLKRVKRGSWRCKNSYDKREKTERCIYVRCCYRTLRRVHRSSEIY